MNGENVIDASIIDRARARIGCWKNDSIERLQIFQRLIPSDRELNLLARDPGFRGNALVAEQRLVGRPSLRDGRPAVYGFAAWGIGSRRLLDSDAAI
jgi:hypothetical protein